ncbi:PAS domain S-box-containing protein [Marivirga sericea]|uniref:PAS domain S-box-containing protein n=1 Tax=Marivirga sericea TaxID=1028 RepID=A0A1X7KD04_9BACT|nr:response regulator [Marivirga sericea]SMG39096.1 PAS domain S-box-containing protein [Marivirga sericea]
MSLAETNGLRVLLIEDNVGDQTLVKEYLQDEFSKLSLDIVDTFKAAKTLLQTAIKPYKIILLDLRLPDIDYHSLLNEIISLSPRSPIIILTGQDDIHIAIEALTLGYTDYLLKDEITSEKLRKSIIYAFERKHIDRQLELSVKRYQELFQLNPQPIWVINDKTHEFLEINNAAIKKYGFSKDEFLNMKIHDIDATYKKENLERHLEDGEIRINDDLHEQQVKSGAKIHVKLYGNPIEYQGMDATLLMAIDVSETDSYIRKIEFQNQQLQDIAWEQSHLVREPLTRMMGIINRLEEKHLEHLDKECQYLLKNALSSAHEIDNVIRSIVQKASGKNK